MALWSRVRQLKFKFNLLPKEFNRCFSLNHGPNIVANQHIRSSTLIPVQNHANLVAPNSQLEFFSKVRFYAAPLKYTQMEEKDAGPRLNEQITTPFLRLVTDEGHTVISRYEALARAKSLNLDLVEVDKDAKPPVCKIFDYDKEKLLQESKDKERPKKSKSGLKKGIKEVRFAAKITQNDLEMKANLVKRQLESGYRVKCMANFPKSKANKPTDNLDLEPLLSRFSELIKDFAIVESEPNVQKDKAFIIVRHAKFGPSKKGPGKKASKAALSGNQSDENQETGPIEPEESLDEDTVSDGDDDIERVFDIKDEVDELPKGSKSSPTADRNPRHAAESAEPVMANRYARDPRAGFPSRDMSGRGARNTMNNIPQIPNQMRPPDSSNPSTHNSPPKNYGIFGGQKVEPTSGEQNGAAESNRYKKNDPSHSSPSTRGVSPQRNPPIFNREVQRR
ncbi:hypothetical protein BUALT_Bualt15G0006700 [Buddleja alternifolia]|uniref:Translation initiation factor 3 N-terminal domain-containing protein n=1 Tax=Buddleja alternifolia TaxID=168488 RepID=A0AAV6W9H3_9LAMI|nr:hypothetical protein BUALT_Bualt15G0006700 [Buddleja alternifolia]